MPNRSVFVHSLLCSISAAVLAISLSSAPARAQTTTADFQCPDQARPGSALTVFDHLAAFMPGARWRASNADVRSVAQERCPPQVKPTSDTRAAPQ